jgi:hypothetical protein
MSGIPQAAEPSPEGNRALAAAVQAILDRRLAASHGIGDDTGRRAALLLEILPDAAAALEAAAPHLRAAERADLAEVLSGHYLAAITCDHDLKRDRPECACSLVDLGWHPSVGEAVQAWIRHVMWRRSNDPRSATHRKEPHDHLLSP